LLHAACALDFLPGFNILVHMHARTGRAIGKEDSIEALTSRAATYAKRVKWVNANRDALVASIKGKMAAMSKSKAMA